MAYPQSAARLDVTNGSREEVFFFGSEQEKMFGCLHRPQDEPRGGIVICSPLLADFRKNYRREVLFSRALAGLGFAVLRFHYRGTGNSDGQTNAVTFASMREDASAAVDKIVRETDIERLVLLGTRLGGLIALSTSQVIRSPLVLWEPILEPSRYFQEAFRAQMMRDMKRGLASKSRSSFVRELEQAGRVDVLGYPIDRAMYESFNSSAAVHVEPLASPILLVQISRSEQLRPEYANLLSVWRRRIPSVDVSFVPEEESWWLASEDAQDSDHRVSVVKTLEVTEDWILASFRRPGRGTT